MYVYIIIVATSPNKLSIDFFFTHTHRVQEVKRFLLTLDLKMLNTG